MASQKPISKSSKDLKLLKKDELVRLLLESNQSFDSPSSNNSKSSKAKSTISKDHRCSTPTTFTSNQEAISANVVSEALVAQVKAAVVEAVSDLKAELRLEYKKLLCEMDEKFTREIDSLRSELYSFQKSASIQLTNLEKDLLRDFQEAELRKDNIMIFGLKESGCSSSPNCKSDDLQSVESLASELGVTELKVRHCHRLGRRGVRPRPLKVTCDRPHQRLELLQAARQIPRLDASLGFRRVFIKPDLSLKEQEVDRQLRRELKIRRDAGEHVFIRGGRIVVAEDLRHKDQQQMD